jgi:hypothetical protein
VDESGKFAVRRPIKIGRQNPQFYEVTDGRSSIDDSRALSWLFVIVPICCQLLRFSPLFVFAYILLEYRVKIGLFWAYSN